MGRAAVNELGAIDQWAGALLAQLSPAGRRAAMRDVARELRRSQQTRIAVQRNPNGSAYEPRKARHTVHGKLRGKRNRIKRAAMFIKLRTTRYLRTEADENGLVVGFWGRVSRVARIHQFGDRERLAPDGPEYQYPARVLLGLTETDQALIRDILLNRFAK